MESKSSHEIYLIVIASVLAAVIIGYNSLLAPKVNGIGIVYQNYDSSQEASKSASVYSAPQSSADDPSEGDVVSSSVDSAFTSSSSNRTDPASSFAGSPSNTAPSSASITPSVVNINTATAAQLETLPGIGTVKAQAILAYREAYGPFRSVNELTLVKGIGEKTLEKLLPYICV